MKHLAVALLLVMLAGCAPTMQRAQINDLPDEYTAKVTPKHLKTYFSLYPAPQHEKFGEVRMEGDTVVAEILTDLGTAVGTVRVSILPDKTLDVVCESKIGGNWLNITRDTEHFKKDIAFFLIGGKR